VQVNPEPLRQQGLLDCNVISGERSLLL